MRMEYDGERAFTFVFERGEQVKKFTFRAAFMIYRGAFKAGNYERGDCVSYGGSIFVALCDVDGNAVPETSKHWQLAAKRGQHGRDGKAGERGERGPAGMDGRAWAQN
jgi:hypothetical protein